MHNVPLSLAALREQTKDLANDTECEFIVLESGEALDFERIKSRSANTLVFELRRR